MAGSLLGPQVLAAIWAGTDTSFHSDRGAAWLRAFRTRISKAASVQGFSMMS